MEAALVHGGPLKSQPRRGIRLLGDFEETARRSERVR